MQIPPSYVIDSMQQWSDLVDTIEGRSRVPRDHWIEKAVEEVTRFAAARRATVRKSELLYRAREMPPAPRYSRPSKHPPDFKVIGPPPPLDSQGGRLNPPGIPYLYLARDAETAVAELRPWTGEFVTVGTFETLSDILVYDLTIEEEERTLANFVYRQLADAFSAPAHRSSARAYAVTQYFAESLKEAGKGEFVGVQYPSAMRAQGRNVALFGGTRRSFEDLVACTGTELRTVTSVTVTSSHVAD